MKTHQARSSCRLARRQLPAAPRLLRPVRRLQVVAFRPDTDTTQLPINHYRALRVARHANKEIIKKAYERQLKNPPDIGYSEQLLAARAALLKRACDTLMDVETRQAYDQDQRNGSAVAVDDDDMPAALCILQECGQSADVLEEATDWLSANPSSPWAPDVGAATALAHCDRAAVALESDSQTVSPAFEHLEAALQLLAHYNLAPHLQEQITEALQEYSSRYSLELLQLPLRPESATQRRQGFEMLRHMLWEMGPETGVVKDRDDLMAAARQVLTAQEQVELYAGLPPGTRLSPQERLDNALAALAVGFSQRQPQVVAAAQQQYQALAAAAAAASQSDLDISVELATCALLLGDPQRALDCLALGPGAEGEGEGEGGRRLPLSHAAIKAYVLANSPDQSDLVPGLVALVQGWLQEQLLVSFRETAGASADLDAWFNSSWVQGYAQVAGMARKVHLGSVVGAVLMALAAAWHWVCGQLVALVAGLWPGGGRRQPADPDVVTINIVSRSSSPMRMQAAAAADGGRNTGGGNGAAAPPSGRSRAQAAGRGPPQAAAAAVEDGHVGVGASAGSRGGSRAGSPAQLERGNAARMTTRAAAATNLALAPEDGGQTGCEGRFDRDGMESSGMTVGEFKQRLGQSTAGEEAREVAAVGARGLRPAAAAAPGSRRARLEQQQQQQVAVEEEEVEEAEAPSQYEEMFSQEAFTARRAALQAMEVAMWDTEPQEPWRPLLRALQGPLGVLLAAGALVVVLLRARGAGGVDPQQAPVVAAGGEVPVAVVVEQRGHGGAAGVGATTTPAAAAAASPVAKVPAAAAAVAAGEQKATATAGGEAAAPAAAATPAAKAAAAALKQAASLPANAPVTVHAGAALDADEARQLVDSWIAARSVALGPLHQVDQLRSVLRGKALQTWQRRAEDLQQESSHYRFQVHRLQLLEVAPWEAPRAWYQRPVGRAQLLVALSDTVTMQPDGAGAAGEATAAAAQGVEAGVGQEVASKRSLLVVLRLQKARWPGAEWRVVEEETVGSQ